MRVHSGAPWRLNRRRGFKALLAAATLVLTSQGSIFAQVPCANRHLFVLRPNVYSGRGQATTVWIVDFVPDETCPHVAGPLGNTNRHHTAHVRRALAGNGWAEVGYVRGLDDAGTEHTWVFVEGHHYPSGQYLGPTFYGAAAVNLWARFKVEADQATGRWFYAWDRGLTGVYAPLGPAEGMDTGFIAGIPMGETAFLGAVDGTDTHDNLWYRTSSFVWTAWLDQGLYLDEIGSSHWHQDSGRKYRVHPPDDQHPN